MDPRPPNFVDDFIRKPKVLNIENSADFVVTTFDAVTGFDAFSDLAALSASDDLTNVDALKSVQGVGVRRPNP